MKKTILLAATLAASMGAAAQGQVNIICSVQADWCNMMATVYSRTTGTKVNMSMKGSGEALAQLIAEKDNPKTDIWFGGTGDPHLQAAEQGLTLEYKSPLLPQLYPWARKQAEDAKYRTVGVYLGPVGFGFNTELLARKKAQAPKSWADLLKPEYKGEVQMANPASSGTAYTVIATLVQIMGEDKAFDYLKSLHKNISTYTRSGTAPIKAAARGETMVSISFVHDLTTEAIQGFPEGTAKLSEGTRRAAVRRGRQAIPAAQQFGHRDRPAHARSEEDQAHQLRLRQVRRLGRAAPPDCEVGKGNQFPAALTSAR